MFDDFVDQPVFLGFLRRHEVVAVGILLDFLQGLAGLLGEEMIEAIPHAQDALGADLNVRSLPLGTAEGLMDHHFTVGKGQPFALGSRRKKEGAHGSSHSDADGLNIALDMLHRIIDGKSGRDGSSR